MIFLIHKIFDRAKTDLVEWNNLLDTEVSKRKRAFSLQVMRPILISIALFQYSPMNYFLLTGILLIQAILCMYEYKIFAKYMILSSIMLSEKHSLAEADGKSLQAKCINLLVELENKQLIILIISIGIVILLFMRDIILSVIQNVFG